MNPNTATDEHRDPLLDMVLEEGQHVCMWYNKEDMIYNFYLHEEPPYINQYIINPRAFTFKAVKQSFVGTGWFIMGFDEAADCHEFQAYKKAPLATTSIPEEVLSELKKDGVDSIVDIVRENFQFQIKQ